MFAQYFFFSIRQIFNTNYCNYPLKQSTAISGTDIQDVARKADLTYAELHNLYGELGILQCDIENQERIANTKDFKIQAVHVLRYWQQTNGREATRMAILHALQECKYNRAKAILEEKWGLTVQGRIRNYTMRYISSKMTINCKYCY